MQLVPVDNKRKLLLQHNNLHSRFVRTIKNIQTSINDMEVLCKKNAPSHHTFLNVQKQGMAKY